MEAIGSIIYFQFSLVNITSYENGEVIIAKKSNGTKQVMKQVLILLTGVGNREGTYRFLA